MMMSVITTADGWVITTAPPCTDHPTELNLTSASVTVCRSEEEDKKTKGCGGDEDLHYDSVEHARIAYAVRRGMSTIFNTSLTTCMVSITAHPAEITPYARASR